MKHILTLLTALLLAPLAALHAQQPSLSATATVRDRLWIFGVAAGLNDNYLELESGSGRDPGA